MRGSGHGHPPEAQSGATMSLPPRPVGHHVKPSGSVSDRKPGRKCQTGSEVQGPNMLESSTVPEPEENSVAPQRGHTG